MNDVQNINYESGEDCFSKTSNVKSYLLYGDQSRIESPLFTVFIPTFQRTELFKEALLSVLRQWHVPFFWDIVVVDNEPYDGTINETEKFIRELDNPRILYYRNSENLRPGDNFNRGFLLARGEWIMMLHDDDILFDNSLYNMYKIIKFLKKEISKPLGAVSVKYHQFKYDPQFPDKHKQELVNAHNYYLSLPINYSLYKLTHKQIIFTGHIGGDIPSNGATYNRKAVIETGGFNENFGISGDLILYYCLENKYAVYSTLVPFGFYRWGINTMSKPESIYQTIKAGYEFREYVYNKNIFNKIWGYLFRKSQHRRFVINVMQLEKKVLKTKCSINNYSDICDIKPNKHIYVFYSLIIKFLFEQIKAWQVKRLYKKSLNYKED